MASNNTNNSTKKNSSLSEDDVLAGLVTNRSETSNYESNVLRQATLQLAPTLKLDVANHPESGADSNKNNNNKTTNQVGFPDLASTSLLAFPPGHPQAKANRKIITQVLLRIQRDMKRESQVEALRVLAMKQHMLLSLLGHNHKQKQKPSLQQAWTTQQQIDGEIYQPVERASLLKAPPRPARVSMMQRKQIATPGSSSLAKAAQQLWHSNNNPKQQRRRKVWKDWSSDEEDNNANELLLNSTSNNRSVLAEMNYSSRRKRKQSKNGNSTKSRSQQSNKKQPSKSRNANINKKKPAATKSMSTSRTSRTSGRTNTTIQPPPQPPLSGIESPPRSKRQRRVISYAENSDDDDDDGKDPNDNDKNDDTTRPNDEDVEPDNPETTNSQVEIKQEDTTNQPNHGNQLQQRGESDASKSTSQVAIKEEPIDENNTTTDNNDNSNTLSVAAEASTDVTCPLCSLTWTVDDPALLDTELVQHMAACQQTNGDIDNSGSPTTRRSRRLQRAATTTTNYNEAEDDDNDDEEEAEDFETTTTKAPSKKRKHSPAATTTTMNESDDFVFDDDNSGSNAEEELEEENIANDDDERFIFDDDMEEEDEDQEAPLIKPTALDDFRLEDYEDRVDWWRLHGLGEMKDLSQLRAEGESDPGAVTLDGGLHIPAWMNNRLFQYQRTGLEWMWTLHQQQAGGVLGDEMGLGKTVQVCGFLGAMSLSRKLKGVLVISPATMLQHWLSELAVWAPGLRRVLLHASGDTTGNSSLDVPNRNLSNQGTAIFHNLRKWLKHARGDYLYERIVHLDGIEDDGEWPEDSFCGTGYVVVTTYEHVRRNQHIYINHPWSYVVLDEAQKIRNPQADITITCKKLRTPHRLAMTGTPIQNDLRELWSLFDFVHPGRLGTLPAFESEFADPIKRGGYSNASPVQIQLAYRMSLVLRDLIDPYLLRRQKSEIEEVRRMPSKTEHVLFCRLSRRQRRMYEAYLESDTVKRIFKGSALLFAAVTMLRKIVNHPDLILSDPSEEALESFLRNGCASDQLIGSDAEDDNDDDDDYDGFPTVESDSENLAKRAGKFEVLSRILPLWKEQGHRVLIFSQWTKMLNIIQRFVNLQGWKFLRLDGKTNVASRQRLVDKFNNDDSYFGMLCTTRTGGVGLNLTGANRIILYDIDWNPQTDAQARERAWRFGQEREVTIYRLCTAGTIEEKMYQRQIFKTALTNKVLHDPRQRRLFSQKDLHDLLTLQPDNGHAREGMSIETTDRIAKANQRAGGGSNGMSAMSSEASKDDSETLKSVLQSKGLAGVFDHNFVDSSAAAIKPASVREMEEKAKLVAKEAADALRASVNVDEEEDPFTPTWTGSESRFGGGNGLKERRGSASSFGGGTKAGVRASGGGSKSSGSLLASLRQQNVAVKSGGSLRPSLSGSSDQGSKKDSKYAKLMVRIRNYVKNNSPSTDELLDEFAFVPPEDAAIFKKLLNTVAKKEGDQWKLLPEHR